MMYPTAQVQTNQHFRFKSRHESTSNNFQWSITTGEILSHLSARIFNLCNTRNFSDSITHHIAPVVRISHENSDIFNYSNLIEHLKGVVSACPNMRIETVNISPWVDENSGTAMVWLTNDVTGSSDDMHYESIAGLGWQRSQDGVWLCTEYMGVRSSAVL